MSPPYQLYPREQYNRQQHEQQQQIMKWGSGWTTSSSSRPPPTPQFRFGSREGCEGFTTPPPPPKSLVYHHPSHPYHHQQHRGSIVCSPSPQFNQRPSAFPSSVYPHQQSQQQQQPQPPLVNINKKKVTFKETCTVRTHRNNTPLTPTEKSNQHYSRQELRTMTLEAHAICILSQELPQRLNEGTLLTKKDRRRSGTFYSTNTSTTSNTSATTTGPKVKRRGSWLGLNEDQDTTTTATPATSSTNNNGSGSIMLDSIRGLELILYTKRKQNKILANRSLLKYQQLLQSKDYLTTERKVQALAVASVKLTTWSKLVALETARLDALRAYDSDYLIPIEPLEGEDTIMPFPYYKKVEDRVSEKCQAEQEHRRQNMKRRRRESYTRRVTFDRPPQGYDGFDNGKRRKT